MTLLAFLFGVLIGPALWLGVFVIAGLIWAATHQDRPGRQRPTASLHVVKPDPKDPAA